MRPFIIGMFLLLSTAFSVGAVPLVIGPDGTLDPDQVDSFVRWVEPSIREYPPRFRDKQQQEQVIETTRQVVKELRSSGTEGIDSQKLLTDIAYIFAMAHNIDLGTGMEAKTTFEKAIAINPKDRRTNYLFGMFLVSTKALHFDGLPYLEQALALGEADAQFTIGLLWVEKGERAKGLEALEAYARQHPESEHVKKVIEAIKDGTLKFKSGG